MNYKNVKKYNIGKKPIRQPIYLTWLIWFLSFIITLFNKKKLEKINMEGLKPPYLMLSNHMSFIDFELTALATYPQRVNNVVNYDGYYKRAWLMEWIGSICTRKFISDFRLVKNINACLKRGDVVCLYPEARYSPNGSISPLPDSLGKLVKMNKVPVVTIVHRGNHLLSPFWNFRKKRKVPLHTTFTQILTKEDVETKSVEEINQIIRDSLVYDEYKYQKENNILIKNKDRAENLHKILYKCPHCKDEHSMDSKGNTLFCTKCNHTWNLNENGTLTCLNDETIFESITDWFNWERQEVREEILKGEYSYSDEVEVHSLPKPSKFYHLGKAKIRHNKEEGWVLEGNYRNKDYKITRTPVQMEALHVEYDYFRIRRDDCFVINTEDDSFFIYPTKKNIITKLAFATEEMFLLTKNK